MDTDQNKPDTQAPVTPDAPKMDTPAGATSPPASPAGGPAGSEPSMESLLGGGSTWTPAQPAGGDTPPASDDEKKKKKKRGMLIALILLLLLTLPIIGFFGVNQIQDVRDRAAPYGGVCDNSSQTASACRGKPEGTCITGTCRCRGTTGNLCACIPEPGCGQGGGTATPTSGGQCASAGGNCTPGATSGSQSCCSGQNLYCQTPAGGGQAKCQQDDGSGGNCGPGGSCTGFLAFRCSQLDGSGRCEQNPKTVGSWSEGVSHAQGCGQVDKVCVGGTRPNTLCGDFQIINQSCGGSPPPPPPSQPPPPPPPGNTPTNTPTKTPTPTPNPQCGGNCSTNAQCPNNHTCSGGKCVLTACTTGSNTCSSDKCTVTNSPTPTPIVGQCENIKIYRSGSVVNPNTLKPGDQIVIAVVGTNATKARVRVNGGAFTETSTKNSAGEYTLNFTIPSSGTTTFTVEAELFIGGSWR